MRVPWIIFSCAALGACAVDLEPATDAPSSAETADNPIPYPEYGDPSMGYHDPCLQSVVMDEHGKVLAVPAECAPYYIHDGDPAGDVEIIVLQRPDQTAAAAGPNE